MCPAEARDFVTDLSTHLAQEARNWKANSGEGKVAAGLRTASHQRGEPAGQPQCVRAAQRLLFPPAL